MNFVKRTVLLHNKRIINILIPRIKCKEITAVDDGIGYQYIISNGSGYEYLSELFSGGIVLEDNEFIYIPFDFEYKQEYNTSFGEKHYKGIVIINYCTTQISNKDITIALKTKIYKESNVIIDSNSSLSYIDDWKLRKRLTIKNDGLLLIISTNSDGLKNLAYSCSILAEYGDDTQYNDFPPHMHHDFDEITSKSLGMAFYYWQH